ncbi:hypothetical protein NQ317_010860 [Molorchus minor]|uniref:Uncharacterized protein n=1 Tax=Molorchus minor TaxID=1323400 RepID=A0ABQ9JZP7_9CUCU|nr:hypothetical protein NQ317_010860 [Molorchus minor]
MNIVAAKAIFLVLVGCMLNNIFLEYIVKLDPGAGHLITFCQFVFIALHGFIFTSKFGTVKPKIIFKDYLILIVFFFTTSVVNNWAFAFNIPVPLHMIFRAGSLIANMILGILLLKKRYSLEKYLSVFLITIGIIICTLYSSKEKPEHLYPIPGFLIYSSSLLEHAGIATKSDLFTIPLVNVAMPILWGFLLLNVITQFMCISNVYILTTECQSLTVTLVITLRKFFSLLFSIIYFQNPFTLAHWIGTVMVFAGTLMFSETHHKIRAMFIHSVVDGNVKTDKKKN